MGTDFGRGTWSAIALVVQVAIAASAARGQIMLSGNENKIDLTGGGQRVVPGAARDSSSRPVSLRALARLLIAGVKLGRRARAFW